MEKKDILVLGIESSCDETSASVVRNGREVLSNVIATQADLHRKFGGVVPEVASRRHVELIIPVIDSSLKDAGIAQQEIDVVAVTCGPGLVGALLVGISAAKALAFSLKKPLVGVHHIEGHICANYLSHQELKPPYMCLVASGGHSHIVYVRDYNSYEIVGKTRDDAAGEAFDKVARVLGLGYPGGPLIDKLAAGGDKNAVDFPKTYFGEGNFDFSFSGIKTAVINYLNRVKSREETIVPADIAASFQNAVIEVLTENLIHAAKHYKVNSVAIAGGVSANSLLRKNIEIAAKKKNLQFYYPELILCTDNAAMIASAGYYRYVEGFVSDLSLNAIPNMRIGQYSKANIHQGSVV